MPYYRCLANGRNFPGALIGRDEPVGFYTTRWVQALNPRAAERKAIALLRRDPSFRSDGTPTPGAHVVFESLERVPTLPLRRRVGAAWYGEGEEPKMTAGERLRDRIAARKVR